jgi:hypothetical protein
MSLFLAVLLKPFIALLIMVPVYLICGAIERWMPESKLKRLLFSPLPGHRSRR